VSRTNDLLRPHREERDALLQRAQELLEADSRVLAAWLTGSLGRGEADDLSDLDLWVVVPDDRLATIRAGSHEDVEAVGRPLLVVDARQNAPVGGAYLLALYPGVKGPLQVDWYWEGMSTARRPEDSRLLFDHVGIPLAEAAPLPSADERASSATARTVFFWAMSDVAAKKIARRDAWGALSLLSLLARTLSEIKWLVTLTGPRPDFSAFPGPPPCPEPASQMALLREMASEMEEIMPRVVALGGHVPWEAVTQTYRFFGLVEALLAEGEEPRGPIATG
jgi:Nucleotidyltransferase domain